MSLAYAGWSETVRGIAIEAGELIMRHRGRGPEASRKEDGSPVTEADLAANRFIVERLAALAPGVPIVSEEGDKPEVRGAEYFWLVDPLDGTRSFLRGEGEFTVNIGLIERGAPVLGVIYIPAEDACYWGAAGEGARRRMDGGPPVPIQARRPPGEGLSVLASLSHFSRETAAFLARLPVHETMRAASSLKFCRIAEGAADLYPRFGKTMEWDSAAGHAILAAAGGRVETPDGQPLLYGKPGFVNGDFLAWGR